MRSEDKAVHSPWEMLYDFLIEIFATMIPGIFFLSFFIFMALILLSKDVLSNITGFARDMSLFMVLVFGSIAYCFGALFHRMEIKKIDKRSAKHIYKKEKHGSGHSFAFARAITDSYMKRLKCNLQVLAMTQNEKAVKPNTDSAKKDAPDKTKAKDLADAVMEEAINDIHYIINSHPSKIDVTDKAELWAYAIRRLVYMIYEEPALKEREDEFTKICKEFAKESSIQLRDELENIVWRYVDTLCGKYSVSEELSGILKKWFFKKKFNRFERFLGREVYFNQAKCLHRKLKAVRKSLPDKNKPWKTGIDKIFNYLESDLYSSIDWPYTHMKRYCLDRGLDFAQKVDWGDGAIQGLGLLDEIGLSTHVNLSDEIKRSKIRINTQKMWISTQDSILYHAISKNEAHIRFMNAITYAATPILLIASASFIVILFGILCKSFPGVQNIWNVLPEGFRASFNITNLRHQALALLVSGIYIFICVTIKRSILEIMHYQRVRELTMILKAQSIIDEHIEKEKAGRDTLIIQKE